MRAAFVLAERDLHAVARQRSQLYSSIFTPLIFLLFLGVGVADGLEPSKLPAGDYKAFLVPGVVVMSLVFSSTFSSASYYRDRDNGVLRALLVTPHSPRALLAGKSLAGVIVGTLQGIIVLAVAAPFVDFGWQYGVVAGFAMAVIVSLLTAAMLGGLAQLFASRITTMQGFHLVMNLALFPLLFFSGAFFPLDDVPVWLRALSWVNPLTYAVDALQVAAYADDTGDFIGLAVDLPVLAALTVLLNWAGLARVPQLTWSGK